MSNPRRVKSPPILHMEHMNISFNHIELCFASCVFPYVVYAFSCVIVF